MASRPSAGRAGGLLATLLAFSSATWFSPTVLNTNFHETACPVPAEQGLRHIASDYFYWLGYVLLVVSVLAAGVGSYRRHRVVAAVGGIVGLVSVVVTLITMYDVSKVGAEHHADAATGPWQNLGAGGWLACIGLSCIGAAGILAATSDRGSRLGDDAPPVQLSAAAPLPARTEQDVGRSQHNTQFHAC